MSAIEAIAKIAKTRLANQHLKFCLVDERKVPFRVNGECAKPNHTEDFVELQDLLVCPDLEQYKGVGISIQASGITAIDIDHCFTTPFDITTADNRAIRCIELFENKAYIEFSFSGTGLRILFRFPAIDNYSDLYYTKNSKQGIEFYQPANSFRYVTVTGRSICDCATSYECISDSVYSFLNEFMKKPKRKEIVGTNNSENDFQKLSVMIKKLYITNGRFQDLWFGKAPGSGRNESELDFNLCKMIFERITTNETQIKLLFESSPYFSTKDWKHKLKWEKDNNRYYHYIYSKLIEC